MPLSVSTKNLTLSEVILFVLYLHTFFWAWTLDPFKAALVSPSTVWRISPLLFRYEPWQQTLLPSTWLDELLTPLIRVLYSQMLKQNKKVMVIRQRSLRVWLVRSAVTEHVKGIWTQPSMPISTVTNPIFDFLPTWLWTRASRAHSHPASFLLRTTCNFRPQTLPLNGEIHTLYLCIITIR